MNKKTKIVFYSIIANAILSFGIVAFILPHGFILGGATGLAVTLSHYTPLELTIAVWIVNLVLYVIGYLCIGKEFALKTLLNTILYPILLSVMKAIPAISTITDDKILCVVFAGLSLGVGSGIIIKVGASTGGSDIIALAISKYLHVPVARVIYIVDSLILISQVPFSSFEQILYGILIIMICTFTINYVLTYGRQKLQVQIISDHYIEIKEAILHDLDLGCTLFDIENPYRETQSKAVMVICDNRMLYNLSEMVDRIDPKAFVTISTTNEVKGRGFTINRDA